MFKYIIHIYLPSNCITYNVQTMVFFNRQSQEVGIPLWVKKKLYKEAPCEQAKMVSRNLSFLRWYSRKIMCSFIIIMQHDSTDFSVLKDTLSLLSLTTQTLRSRWQSWHGVGLVIDYEFMHCVWARKHGVTTAPTRQ